MYNIYKKYYTKRENVFYIKKTLLILASVPMFLSATEYQLSTHVLDITSGQPAPKVKVELYKLEANK